MYALVYIWYFSSLSIEDVEIVNASTPFNVVPVEVSAAILISVNRSLKLIKKNAGPAPPPESKVIPAIGILS